jgi:protein gp37
MAKWISPYNRQLESDLFHEDVPDEFIRRVFNVLVAAYWHIFQVFTMRPLRMANLAHTLP